MWAPSYFTASRGAAPPEIVKEYIHGQKQPDQAGASSRPRRTGLPRPDPPMSRTDELRDLVDDYARGDLTDEEFLQRLESQRVDIGNDKSPTSNGRTRLLLERMPRSAGSAGSEPLGHFDVTNARVESSHRQVEQVIAVVMDGSAGRQDRQTLIGPPASTM